MRAFLGRAIRAVKIVVRDGRIPEPLRWGAALGLLPVPGPFDEIVLLGVGGIVWLFYRDQLADAWRKAAATDEGPAWCGGGEYRMAAGTIEAQLRASTC